MRVGKRNSQTAVNSTRLLNGRSVVAEDLARELDHSDNPVNKRRACFVQLVGLLRGGDVEAVQALSELVHGDGNNLAQVLIHDERQTHVGVLEEEPC